MRGEVTRNEFAFQLDPEGLKSVDLLQARFFLEAIIGKTIATATMAADRTTISTSDGLELEFCRFGGQRYLRSTV